MRNNKNKVNIENRLKITRRTMYALLGPGLHARKGMSPIVSANLWQTYVIPRSLYGIEVLNYTKTDILKFERLQLQICRQIQSVVDKLLLTFFRCIIQDEDSIEYRIVERQLQMPSENINTFVNRLKAVLHKYGLPKPDELLETVPTKQQWKITVKDAIQKYWEEKWEKEKSEKSTMKFLDIKKKPIGNPHQIWNTAPKTTIEVRKAEDKATLITRNYTLQSDKAKFTKNQENEIYPLCHSDTEDTEHFLLICPSLKSVRDRHLSVLRKYMASNFGNDILNQIENEGLTIQFLLDSSSVKLRHIVKFKTENLRDIENMTRTSCLGMHTRRSSLFKNR